MSGEIKYFVIDDVSARCSLLVVRLFVGQGGIIALLGGEFSNWRVRVDSCLGVCSRSRQG